MAVKQMRVCDLPNCVNLAPKSCAICERDICQRHVHTQMALGPYILVTQNPANALPAANTTVLAEICQDCSDMMKLPLVNPQAVDAALEQARQAYLEALRAAWAARLLEPPAAQLVTSVETVMLSGTAGKLVGLIAGDLPEARKWSGLP